MLEQYLERRMLSMTFRKVFSRGSKGFTQVKNGSLGSNPSEAVFTTQNTQTKYSLRTIHEDRFLLAQIALESFLIGEWQLFERLLCHRRFLHTFTRFGPRKDRATLIIRYTDSVSKISYMGTTIIEIRPHRSGWQVFEAPGVEPVFLKKGQMCRIAPALAKRIAFA